jgi:hypothetical protein
MHRHTFIHKYIYMYIHIFIDICTSVYFRLVFSKMVIEIKEISTSIESYEKNDINYHDCNIDNNDKTGNFKNETDFINDNLHEKYDRKVSELKCLLKDLLQIVASLGIHTYVYILKHV